MTTPISANTSKWRESVMDGPGVKGLIDHAADDVADDQRLPREPGERAAQHGGDQDEGEIAEEEGLGSHRAAP